MSIYSDLGSRDTAVNRTEKQFWADILVEEKRLVSGTK